MTMYALLLLCVMVGTALGELTSHPCGNEDSMKDLFSDFLCRNESLHVCEGYGGGLKYKIPKIPDCPIYKDIKKIAKVVTVTPFWPDNERVIDAVSCTSKKYQHQVSKNIWFQEIESRVDLGHINITSDDCKLMWNLKISPTRQELVRLREGQFGTMNHQKADGFWLSTQYAENVNFFLTNLHLAVDHTNGNIKTVIPTTKNCHIKDGMCPTEDGMLMWKVPTHPMCSIKEGTTSICLKTGNRISCPETQFLYTGVTSETICDGLPVSMSEQNVILTTAEPNQLSSNSSSLSTIRSFLGINTTENRTGTRTRRSRFGVNNLHYSTDQEVNLVGNFVADAIKDGHSFDIQSIANDVCHIYQELYRMAFYLAEIGHTSAIARIVSKDLSVEAKFLGDAIMIWECPKVNRYHFIPRTECIKEWPVRYVIGNDVRTGYVQPYTHKILHTPTYIPCPADQFHFNMGGQLLLLGNKTAVNNDIPNLPLKTNFSSPNAMRDLSLKAIGEHSVPYQYGVDMAQVAYKQHLLDQAITHVIVGLPLPPKEADYLSSVQDIINAPLVWKIKLVVTIIGGAFVILVLVLLVTAFAPLQEIVKSFCGMGVLLCNCLNYLFPRCKTSQDTDIDVEKGLKLEQYSVQPTAPQEDKDAIELQVFAPSILPRFLPDALPLNDLEFYK